jgi:hypothetical protein
VTDSAPLRAAMPPARAPEFVVCPLMREMRAFRYFWPFRATGITAYLEGGGTLENAQAMAAHESPRTTKLYDRTGDEITLDEVERIRI